MACGRPQLTYERPISHPLAHIHYTTQIEAFEAVHRKEHSQWPSYLPMLKCLACMQVVLLQLPLIKDEAQVKTLVKKLGPPLVTLLSEEAEIQYVALRNINLIVQKYPEVLSYEIKVHTVKRRPARPVLLLDVNCN